MDYKSEFIKFMAMAGVLTFGDFITKSGRKTPYFVNTGKYSSGRQISRLGGFYANCIMENLRDTEGLVLFGPAYKGIPLVVSTAIALCERGIHVNYCFNRKEVKDHGEGGSLVGHKPGKSDRVIIIEDVITAGTAVREVLPILQGTGAAVEGLIISVDRMEKGAADRTGKKAGHPEGGFCEAKCADRHTAIQEIWEEYKIPTYPIVNVKEVRECLHNKPVDGKVFIDDEISARMEAYMKEYCR